MLDLTSICLSHFCLQALLRHNESPLLRTARLSRDLPNIDGRRLDGRRLDSAKDLAERHGHDDIFRSTIDQP